MSPNSGNEGQTASDTMSPPHESGTTAKRKGDDGTAQPRAKRNRYISIAW